MLTSIASNCQNGVVTTVPTQSTQSLTVSRSSGQITPITGSKTGSTSPAITTRGSQTGTTSNSLATTSSGGPGNNTPSLPPNVYPTSPSGLVCTATPFVWCDGAMTFEPMPTYNGAKLTKRA
jgi:hypothetical protein